MNHTWHLDDRALRACGKASEGRLLVILGAGRGAHVDRPDLFFSAVGEFLHDRWLNSANSVVHQ